jgi:type I restriction enzyme, S subunit
MRDNWPQAQLGDHVDLLTGFPFKSAQYCARTEGVRLLRGDNVVQRNLRWDGAKYWPNRSTSEFASYELRPSDVVLAMDRPWIEAGLKVAALRDADCPSLLVQRVARLRACGGLDQGFLKWLMYSQPFTDHVLAVQTGTAVPHISGQQIREFRFLLPPLEEQRRIAGVLGAVDDLIDSNRFHTGSLTSLVQAEFERRFGRRDLGLTIADVALVIDCLHSKKPERAEAGGLLLQLNNILDSGLLDLTETYLIDSADYLRWTKNLETQQWDCVITNVGRIGAVARIPSGATAALGRNMTAIRPLEPSQDGAFVLAALLSPAVRREIELRTDTGTILNALNVRNIPKLRLQSASRSERGRFQAFAAPLLKLADILHEERLSLSRQRDELLPLLLSGRVRVEDVAA